LISAVGLFARRGQGRRCTLGQRGVHFTIMAVTTSTKRLRASLADTLARASRGEEIVVTRRGKPYVRISPVRPRVARAAELRRRYPLRGSIRHLADDFDAPLPRLWKALDK
jgi:prevent-host-death family protein